MKAWIWTTGIVSLVIALFATWWLWPRKDPQIAKVEALQEQLFAVDSKVPPEKRRELFRALREEAEKLPEDQREGIMEAGFERRMEEQLSKYFDAPEADRVAILDAEIDQMQERFGGAGRDRSGPRGGDRGDRQARGDRGPRPDGPPGGGRGRGGTPEERRARSRARMDRSTPEMRARAQGYFTALDDRRRERGLPEMPRGPFGR